MKKIFSNKVTLLLFLALFLVSCGPPTSVGSTPVSTDPETQSSRIIVVDASRFTSADGKLRDILVLRDTKTSKEFIAVMGAGVIEINLQSCGKNCWHEVENP